MCTKYNTANCVLSSPFAEWMARCVRSVSINALVKDEFRAEAVAHSKPLDGFTKR